MKFTDYLHNSSKLTINVYDLNTDDHENEFITGETRFDWTLTIQLKNGDSVHSGKGDWIGDFTQERFEGEHYEAVEEDLLLDLRRVLIQHVIDSEL